MAKAKRTTRTGTKGTCIIEGCENEAEIADLCSPCYQYEWRWGRRTPAARRERLKAIQKYEARLERLSSPRLRAIKGGKK